MNSPLKTPHFRMAISGMGANADQLHANEKAVFLGGMWQVRTAVEDYGFILRETWNSYSFREWEATALINAVAGIPLSPGELVAYIDQDIMADARGRHAKKLAKKLERLPLTHRLCIARAAMAIYRTCISSNSTLAEACQALGLRLSPE